MPSDSKDSKILLETSLQTFFFDELSLVNNKSSNSFSGEFIHYISTVMDKFSVSENYFDEQKDGKYREKMLGIKLLKSNNLSKKELRVELKDVGDTALFLCGFFGESLNRKIVDPKYYEKVGMSAYDRLNIMIPNVYDFPSFYKALSRDFQRIVLLMNIVYNNFKESECDNQYYFIVNNTKIV